MKINLIKIFKSHPSDTSLIIDVLSCEDIGLKHGWEEIDENILLLSFPPFHTNRKRRCVNCGKIEELVTIQQEIKEWVNIEREENMEGAPLHLVD